MSTAISLPDRFRRIWGASAASALGDGVYFSALPLLALSYTHNPVLLGALQACTLLPWLFFGLIGGALVDRWDRRRTMWITDACRFGLLAGLTVAVATGTANIYVLFTAAFLLGIGQIFFDTASMAYLPEILDRDPQALQKANARLRGAQQALGEFVGPPTGSVLFAIGRTVPVIGNAASFLISSLTIRTLPKSAPQPAKKGSLLRDAKEGAAYLFGNKVLLGLSLRPAVGNFAFMGTNAVLVLYVHDTLHLPTSAYGIYLTSAAIGGLAGTALATKVAKLIGTGGALTATVLVEAVSMLGIGLAPNAWLAGVGEAVIGAAIGVVMVLGPSTRQAIVPAELMGRVGATGRLIALGSGPVGALFGGWLAHVAGLRAPFVAGAVVLASMTLVTATLTNNKKIDAELAASAARARGLAEALA